MFELIGITLGLALIDSLNPATITSMAVLLPLVKKVEHALYFLFSTYLVYYIGGFFLYFGIDRILGRWITEIWQRYSMPIIVAEVVLGLALFAVGIGTYVKGKTQTVTADHAQSLGIRSLQPAYLFFFGVVSTFSDLPTAFPLIGFIGKMVEVHPSVAILLILLGVYVLIYVTPILILYLVFKVMREKMHQITDWLICFINWFTRYALPSLVAFLGAWLVFDGLSRIL